MDAIKPQSAPVDPVALDSVAAEPDLLTRVVDALHKRKGTIREIARSADMSYDTVRRIKNRENDPSYGKVVRLAVVLGLGNALRTRPSSIPRSSANMPILSPPE